LWQLRSLPLRQRQLSNGVQLHSVLTGALTSVLTSVLTSASAVDWRTDRHHDLNAASDR
jgi:hypothetical protein